jgi:hemolysin D
MALGQHSSDASMPPLRARARRADAEFLPAALELIETPASPISMALMGTICCLVVVVLIWGYFGHLDILAIAQGKIQPSGRVKVIQPLETGKVTAIHVKNGKHVEAGAILVELEPTEALADETGTAAGYAAFKAEAERRRAALIAAKAGTLTEPPKIAWAEDIPRPIREREEEVLADDLRQLAAQIGSLDAQLAQKRAEEAALQATIESQSALVSTLQERVDMREKLAKTGAGARAPVIDALETMQYHQTTLMTQKGQLEEAAANIEVLAQERDKIFRTFISDNGQKYAEAARQGDDYEQRLTKARAKREHMTLVSPVAGAIMSLSVTTLGQVVTTSEELMRIVPDDAGLEIECYLQNKDIGFVAVGQEAQVKIESFPFTRYGTIKARVTNVARDAIPEPDAQMIEGDPAKATKSGQPAGTQRTQNLVFPVALSPDRLSIEADGADIDLSPGMAVSVEIKTGRRRILEYVFSPLVETASRAMKER